MKSKQLANVLFKVLGFSICLYAIPSCVSGIAYAISVAGESKAMATEYRIFSAAVGAGVQAVVGIIVIAMSRKISGWMFKNDDE